MPTPFWSGLPHWTAPDQSRSAKTSTAPPTGPATCWAFAMPSSSLLLPALFILLLAVVGVWPGAVLLFFDCYALLAGTVLVVAHQFLKIIIDSIIIQHFALPQHMPHHLHQGHIQRTIAVRLGSLHQLIDHGNRIFMRALVFESIPNHQ